MTLCHNPPYLLSPMQVNNWLVQEILHWHWDWRQPKPWRPWRCEVFQAHTQIWIWNWLWKQTNCRPGLPTAKLKKLTYRTLNLPPTELWNSETTATGHNRMHGAFEVQIRCLREMTMERLFWCTDICTAILSECIFHQDLPSNSPLSWIYEPHTVIVQNCSSNKWRNYRRKSFKTS